MVSVERSFAVTPPPARVIDYLKDFGNAEEWDPGTQTCTRIDDGPVKVGSSWRNESKIFGVTAKLVYHLNRLDHRTIEFVGENDNSTSTDTITVDPDGEGSVVTYHADLQMKGAAKLLTPAMKLAFEKLAGDVEEQLTRVLNGL